MDPIENDTREQETHNTVAHKIHTLNAQTKMGVVVALIIFLALIVLGVLASRSLPGDALYSLKTDFIETLNNSVQFSEQDKAKYQVERMKNRLSEIQKFDENGGFTQEAHEDLSTVVTEHFEALRALAESNPENAPSEAMLNAINDFASVALAMESISERNDSLTEFGEFIEDVRRDSVNLYKDQVDRYVERTDPEAIYEFVRTQLSDVSDGLNTENIHPQTIDDAEVYINRVGPAMAEANYPRAIAAIAEAMRFIKIDIYGAIEDEPQENPQDTASSTEDTGTSTPEESTTTSDVTTQSFSFPQ